MGAVEVLELVSKLDVPVDDEEPVVETVEGGAEEVGEKRRREERVSVGARIRGGVTGTSAGLELRGCEDV